MSHDNHTAYIIDGMALIQALDESKFDTFNDLGLVVMQIIQSLLTSNLGVTSVTLVFDRYDCEISIKQLERDRRTGRDTTPRPLHMSSVVGVGLQTTEIYEKRHKQISTGRVNLCILDRYGSTYHQGTPMDYAGRRFQQWPLGKGC